MKATPRYLAALALALGASHVQAQSPMPAADMQSSPWALAVSVRSHHFNEPSSPGARWNEENWGIGAQYDLRMQGTNDVVRLNIGALKDSLGAWGGYATGAYLWHVTDAKGFTIRLGAGSGLGYRTLRWMQTTHFNFSLETGTTSTSVTYTRGRHELLPLLLFPVLSVEHAASGFGANLVTVPRLSFGDKGELPGFIFLQVYKRF